MRILQVHNAYVHPGGEDAVVRDEKRLLESYGHEVRQYRRDNTEILSWPAWRRAAFFLTGRDGGRRPLMEILERERPDLIHVHNPFYLVGTDVYRCARRWGIPLVQTLHNFRLLCPAGTCFREGRPCEACRPDHWTPAVRHRCWRGSRAATRRLVGMIRELRRALLEEGDPPFFIALSAFSRDRFSMGGFPRNRMAVKANVLVPDPGPVNGIGRGGLYVGAMVPYKGVEVLLEARRRAGSGESLILIGEGPSRKGWERRFGGGGIRFLGRRGPGEVLAAMGRARYVVVPSLCYEHFPRVIAEACARGVPVIAAGHGSLAEWARDGETGLLFPPGDAAALAACLRRLDEDAGLARRLGRGARGMYEAFMAPEPNYRRLMTIYAAARGETAATGEAGTDVVCGCR